MGENGSCGCSGGSASPVLTKVFDLPGSIALGSDTKEVSILCDMGDFNAVQVSVVVKSYATLTRITFDIEMTLDGTNFTPGSQTLMMTGVNKGTFSQTGVSFKYFRVRYTTMGTGSTVFEVQVELSKQ